MRQTKKITLSAIMAALSVVLIALGALLSVAELAIAAFCSLIVVFIHVEVGTPYQFLTWIVVSLLTALMFPSSFGYITYFLIFGIYPIIRHYIEKLPAVFAWIIKLVYFNAALVLLMIFSELVFGIPLFVTDEPLIKAGLYLLCIGAFVVYDFFLKVMIRAYFEKYRARFARFLK